MTDSLRITKEDVKRRMDLGEEFVFIDVRNPGPWERAALKIKGAIRIALNELDRQIESIPKNKPVVTYCT
jgi:rhodanese-related sulfurtransferase